MMRGFQRLSIRLRITLGSLLIAILLLGAAVVLLRGQVESILNNTTLTLLRHDAAPSIAEVKLSAHGQIDVPGRGQLVAIVDPNDVVVETTLPKSLHAKIGTLLSIGSRVEVVRGGDDLYRVLTNEVKAPDGYWHVITARNDESTVLLLDRLTQALIAGAVVLVFAFGAASWILTGASLRPVTRMRRQAEAIVAMGSTEPLPTGPAKDELSALGMTLNDLITDVRKSAERERQLVSDASHELRSPLAVLMTQLELAHLNSGNAVALEKEISAAEQNVKRLSELAMGLLELSQLESTASDAQSTWAEIQEELVTSVDEARMLAVSSKVTVDFEVIDGLVAHGVKQIYAIAPTNFSRIVANLTSNAIAATPPGGIVSIALRETSSHLELTVADTGRGLAPAFIPVAFDRFSRPDDARTRRTGGAGLGLAIVHAIVSAAHGEVTLANRTVGLVVTVRIPRKALSRPVPGARTLA
jgi:two-component system, OmpR family, sensor kinase